MSIRFDSQGCFNAFRMNLIEAMRELQGELFSNSKNNMVSDEAKNELTEDDITDIANVITVSISGGAWAIMDEWGYGSLLDEDNPSLDDYKNSVMWNPARSDNTIRSRPNMAGQRNIFGEAVNGRGDGGVDLEELGIVSPTPPTHAIRTAMRWMEEYRFRERIEQVIADFPFHSFFITDNK